MCVLKAVIKMYECEIIREKKVETVTVTLMNRALNPSNLEDNHRYFSVQSEANIWWFGSFEEVKHINSIYLILMNIT